MAGFATARKVTTYVYRLLRRGHAYVDEGTQACEQENQAPRVRRIKAPAAQLGYQLAPLTNGAAGQGGLTAAGPQPKAKNAIGACPAEDLRALRRFSG